MQGRWFYSRFSRHAFLLLYLLNGWRHQLVICFPGFSERSHSSFNFDDLQASLMIVLFHAQKHLPKTGNAVTIGFMEKSQRRKVFFEHDYCSS
jgi:hypothetical protein